MTPDPLQSRLRQIDAEYSAFVDDFTDDETGRLFCDLLRTERRASRNRAWAWIFGATAACLLMACLYMLRQLGAR